VPFGLDRLTPVKEKTTGHSRRRSLKLLLTHRIQAPVPLRGALHLLQVKLTTRSRTSGVGRMVATFLSLSPVASVQEATQ
jgi:hypothetical protein